MRPDISCEMKPASEKIRKHLCSKYDLKSQYIGLTFTRWMINYLGIIGKLSKARFICVLLSMAEYSWLPWLLWVGFVNWVGSGDPSKGTKKVNNLLKQPFLQAGNLIHFTPPLFAVPTACCVPRQIPVRNMKENSREICYTLRSAFRDLILSAWP